MLLLINCIGEIIRDQIQLLISYLEIAELNFVSFSVWTKVLSV
jgi:hypothetical protein